MAALGPERLDTGGQNAVEPDENTIYTASLLHMAISFLSRTLLTLERKV